MNDIRAELDALNQRIARLERQNRRLRQASLYGMRGATAPKVLAARPRHAPARGLSASPTFRYMLALLILVPGVLWARQKLELKPVPQTPAANQAVAEPVVAPEFVVRDTAGKVRAVLDGKGLFLFGGDRQMRVWLTPEDLVYKGEDGRIRAALKASREQSSLVLRDAEGDETDLGNATLTQPGAIHHRSAASLVLIRRGAVVKQLP